jgi:hypothetical protein
MRKASFIPSVEFLPSNIRVHIGCLMEPKALAEIPACDDVFTPIEEGKAGDLGP